MGIERDKERLAEYEAELADLDSKLAELERLQVRREGVRKIVDGLRFAIGAHEEESSSGNDLSNAFLEGSARIVPGTTGVRIFTPLNNRRPVIGGGVKQQLLDLLKERGTVDADEAVEFISATYIEREIEPPSRNTIVSRLGDLVRDGLAVSPAKGVYQSESSAPQLEEQPKPNPFLRIAEGGEGTEGEPPGGSEAST
jgi:hypothetical protein